MQSVRSCSFAPDLPAFVQFLNSAVEEGKSAMDGRVSVVAQGRASTRPAGTVLFKMPPWHPLISRNNSFGYFSCLKSDSA